MSNEEFENLKEELVWAGSKVAATPIETIRIKYQSTLRRLTLAAVVGVFMRGSSARAGDH